MDRRTEKSNFIGRCPTNIECPKREEIKKIRNGIKRTRNNRINKYNNRKKI